MPHYEVLTFKTAPENVSVLGEDYAAFGWKRITKSDYKTLLEKPDQPDETPVQGSVENVKREQTLYPDSPAFSDLGDNHPFVDPSPNDSAAYDGLQNMYFRRDNALEHKDAIDELKKKYDGVRQQIHEQEEVILHKKGVGHTLFALSVLPLVVGFFVLMTGIVCAVLGAVEPDEFSKLTQPGIATLISGGFLFSAGWILIILSMVLGINTRKEKAMRQAMIPLEQEKADLLLKASALTRAQGGAVPIAIKIVH
jgi:hypothetical protein